MLPWISGCRKVGVCSWKKYYFVVPANFIKPLCDHIIINTIADASDRWLWIIGLFNLFFPPWYIDLSSVSQHLENFTNLSAVPFFFQAVSTVFDEFWLCLKSSVMWYFWWFLGTGGLAGTRHICGTTAAGVKGRAARAAKVLHRQSVAYYASAINLSSY